MDRADAANLSTYVPSKWDSDDTGITPDDTASPLVGGQADGIDARPIFGETDDVLRTNRSSAWTFA